MKKVILLAACTFTLSVTICAQEAPANTERAPSKSKQQRLTPEQQAQKNVDKLNAELTLTPDQKLKIHDLAVNRANKANEIRVKYKGQTEKEETAQKELDAIRKEYHEAVKSLLTAEQLEKVKAHNKEKKAAKGAKPAESNVIDAND